MFISKLSGIPKEKVKSYLKILIDANIIKFANNIYSPSKNKIDIGLHPLLSQKIRFAWRERILEANKKNITTPDKDYVSKKHLSAYYLCETDTELDREIFNLTNKYYVELLNLSSKFKKENRPSTSLRLINIDLFAPLENTEDLFDLSK